jgi:hypothetical protein
MRAFDYEVVRTGAGLRLRVTKYCYEADVAAGYRDFADEAELGTFVQSHLWPRSGERERFKSEREFDEWAARWLTPPTTRRLAPHELLDW